MKKITFILAMLLFTGSLAFSQANRRYVAVQNTPLKSSTGFFSSNLGNLVFGDAVTLISDNGKWSKVQSGNLTGWVASSNLSARRIIQSNSSVVSANEIALAGKGFSPDTELEYKKNGLDFSMVDNMEQITVPARDLLRFITEGRLSKGE